jgi:hypothetical protein
MEYDISTFLTHNNKNYERNDYKQFKLKISLLGKYKNCENNSLLYINNNNVNQIDLVNVTLINIDNDKNIKLPYCNKLIYNSNNQNIKTKQTIFIGIGLPKQKLYKCICDFKCIIQKMDNKWIVYNAFNNLSNMKIKNGPIMLHKINNYYKICDLRYPQRYYMLKCDMKIDDIIADANNMYVLINENLYKLDLDYTDVYLCMLMINKRNNNYIPRRLLIYLFGFFC